MCALKTALAEVKVYGPSGDPKAPPKVSHYTEVPWSIIDAKDREKEADPGLHRSRTTRWQLGDENAIIRTFSFLSPFGYFHDFYFPWLLVDSTDDVFGDPNEVWLMVFLVALILTNSLVKHVKSPAQLVATQR